MRRVFLSVLLAAGALVMLSPSSSGRARLTGESLGSGLSRNEAMQIKHAIARSLNKLQKRNPFRHVKVTFRKVSPANVGMLGISGLKIVGQVERKVSKNIYLGGVTFVATLSKPLTPQAEYRVNSVKVTGKLPGLAATLIR